MLDLSAVIKDHKIVMLEFWGSWCGPCIEKARKIKPLYEDYKNKGFEIVGVAMETNKDRWLKVLKKENYACPNVVELEQNQEQQLFISKLYQADSYPYCVLIDQEGTIISINPSVEELAGILQQQFK